MKNTLLGVCCVAALTPFLSSTLAAQEATEDTTPLMMEPLVSAGTEKVSGRIVEDFFELAGDDTQALVDALRNGEGLTLQTDEERIIVDDNGDPVLDADGNEQTEIVNETVSLENNAGPMGYGEISLALGLADALLADGFTRSDLIATLSNVDANGILDKRADGMGWGEIFASYDLQVGEVMRSIKSRSRPAAEQALKVDKPARSQSGDKPVKPEKPAKPQRPEKPARPERPDKPEKPEKPERPEKPEKPEKPERANR